MTPAIIVGDLHLKMSNLDVAEPFFKTLMEEIDNSSPKSVVFVGDIHDAKSIVYVGTQDFFIEKVKEILAKGVKVYIIVGNHDFATVSYESHSLTPLGLLDGVTIVDKSLRVEEFLLVAYNKPSVIESIIKKNKDAKFLLGHFALMGADYGNGYCEQNGTNKKLVEKTFDNYIFGHIHKPSEHYIGSPWSHSFGEANQHKQILVIESYKDPIERIKIEGLPRHLTIVYKKGLEKSLAKIRKNSDIVRILDIPKIKIEEVRSATKTWASVQYVMKVETSSQVRIDETKDHRGIILDYIKAQKEQDRFEGVDKKKLVKMALKYLGE